MDLITRKSVSSAEIGEDETALTSLGLVDCFLEMKHHAFTAIAKLPRILNRFSATATARLVLQKAKRLVNSHR